MFKKQMGDMHQYFLNHLPSPFPPSTSRPPRHRHHRSQAHIPLSSEISEGVSSTRTHRHMRIWCVRQKRRNSSPCLGHLFAVSFGGAGGGITTLGGPKTAGSAMREVRWPAVVIARLWPMQQRSQSAMLLQSVQVQAAGGLSTQAMQSVARERRSSLATSSNTALSAKFRGSAATQAATGPPLSEVSLRHSGHLIFGGIPAASGIKHSSQNLRPTAFSTYRC